MNEFSGEEENKKNITNYSSVGMCKKLRKRLKSFAEKIQQKKRRTETDKLKNSL